MATHHSTRFPILTLALAGVPFLLAESAARAEKPGRVGGVNHQRGVGVSPFATKEHALEQLQDVRDQIGAGVGDVGEREHALEELDDAIEELGESLDPELWLRDDLGNVEGSHLDPEEGAHVFHEERHCAQEIFDAIREGEIDEPDLRDALLAIVDTLVLVDRQLADIQISDAIGAGGDAEEIDEALDQLARGDQLVKQAAQQGRLEQKAALLYEAIDDAYRHAWEEAIDATEEEFSGLSSERHSGCGLGQCGGRRWSHRTPA